MAVQVNENNNVRHDGIIYKAGEVIHTLAEDTKAELVKLGVVKDLEVDATQVENQVKADAATIGSQIQEDEDLVRGQVEDQVKANAAADVAAAKALDETPGTPVAPTAPEASPAEQTLPENQPPAA